MTAPKWIPLMLKHTITQNVTIIRIRKECDSGNFNIRITWFRVTVERYKELKFRGQNQDFLLNFYNSFCIENWWTRSISHGPHRQPVHRGPWTGEWWELIRISPRQHGKDEELIGILALGKVWQQSDSVGRAVRLDGDGAWSSVRRCSGSLTLVVSGLRGEGRWHGSHHPQREVTHGLSWPNNEKMQRWRSERYLGQNWGRWS
jgi:hypothetical protein